ncbi:MAG: hypothetical protein JW776_08325 [Candidatus Lokiarchaeota archaeon]|nr:hypothetical protein [Candidatus Lokiarchaeota archaeon]
MNHDQRYRKSTVDHLPEWKIPQFPDVPLADTNYTTTVELEPQGYTYKNPISQKEILDTEVKIVKMELEKNKSVKIRVGIEESARISHSDAVPCVMVIGEDFHPFDFWASFFSSIGLMGYPLEFAMGTANQPAEIAFTPQCNKLVRVAFWVLRGPLKTASEEKSFGMKASDVNKFLEIVRNQPFYLAWLGHNYDIQEMQSKWKNNDQSDWKTAPLNCSILPGVEGTSSYRNLLPSLLEKYGINPMALCGSNADQKRWLAITERMSSLSETINKTIEMVKTHALNINENPLFKIRLQSYLKHPSLYIDLLKNHRKYINWSKSEVHASFIMMEIAQASSTLEILESEVSVVLADFLTHLAAFDAIITTKNGLVTASTSKNFQLTLWENDYWSVLEDAMDTHELGQNLLLISEAQREPVLECDYVMGAVSLLDENGTIIGWLLMKIVIGG